MACEPTEPPTPRDSRNAVDCGIMVNKPKQQVLQRAVLASGLLDAKQLEVALQRIGTRDEVHPFAVDKIDDERLGETLIELGYLNHWQVEQLRAGRTKFTLGPYQIVDSIGRGGMGHVFKAHHSMLGRVEAVKVLPKRKSSPKQSKLFSERFVPSTARSSEFGASLLRRPGR